MQLENFAFADDLIGIECGSQYWDLHNNFTFSDYQNVDGVLRLIWKRCSGAWVPADLPETVSLKITGVSKFEVRGEPGEGFDEFGFFPSETSGNVDHNGSSSPSEGSDVLVFRFDDGSEIAIQGTNATVGWDDV